MGQVYFTSVSTTRGQEIIRVVVVLVVAKFSFFGRFLEVNRAHLV